MTGKAEDILRCHEQRNAGHKKANEQQPPLNPKEHHYLGKHATSPRFFAEYCPGYPLSLSLMCARAWDKMGEICSSAMV